MAGQETPLDGLALPGQRIQTKREWAEAADLKLNSACKLRANSQLSNGDRQLCSHKKHRLRGLPSRARKHEVLRPVNCDFRHVEEVRVNQSAGPALMLRTAMADAPSGSLLARLSRQELECITKPK